MISSVTDQKIRILMADDHPIFFAKAFTAILSLQKDMKVVGKGQRWREACRLYDQLSPDVLISTSGCQKKMGLRL